MTRRAGVVYSNNKLIYDNYLLYYVPTPKMRNIESHMWVIDLGSLINKGFEFLRKQDIRL